MADIFKIKAKKDGLDLYFHNQSVLDTAMILNSIYGLGLNTDILRYAAMFHDLGKANPLFQENMERNNYDKVCRHELSSLLFINNIPLSQEERDIVAFTIITHHKSLEINEGRSFVGLYDMSDSEFKKNHIGNIEEWGKTVASFMNMHYGIYMKIPTQEECCEIYDYYYDKSFELQNGVSLYRGIFQMADHFASAFPDDKERLSKLSSMFAVPNVSCYEKPNERYPLSLIKSDDTKKHTIVIAPTGSGKTNAVLKRCKGRIFYLLPFQASINAMFQRVRNDLPIDNFIGIRHASVNNLSFVDNTTKEISKFFGNSVMVATPFQILSPIFKLKGHEMTEIDLQGQDVILDEIHTYSGITQATVVTFIKYLISIGCRIHVCTATIPSALLEQIIEILGSEDTQIIRLSNDELDSFNRHIMHTCDKYDINDILARYDNGEKVLVVRNQVKLAQEMYGMIKKARPDIKILLIHSRYERWRRAEIEKLLMSYNSSDKGCIVVSTQVVEVSLDINFDVMFTDCAGIKSLIQRFGRVNRQRENIGILKDVFVIRNEEKTFLPYEDTECTRTFDVLSEYDGQILQERLIQTIIDKVDADYKVPSITPPTSWKMFSNNINTSISEMLDFSGFVGILRKNVDAYLATQDPRYEIPLSSKKLGKRNLSPLISGDKEIGFIIEENDYDDEFGAHSW